jgi:hypothetical protein
MWELFTDYGTVTTDGVKAIAGIGIPGVTSTFHREYGVVVFGQIHVGIGYGGAAGEENEQSYRECCFESFHSSFYLVIELVK